MFEDAVIVERDGFWHVEHSQGSGRYDDWDAAARGLELLQAHPLPDPIDALFDMMVTAEGAKQKGKR